MFGGRKTPQAYPICEAWSIPAFAASWPGRLVKESVRTSVWERNIKRKREAEQSCDPKHTDGSTKEWLKKNKDVWKWSRQSSDHSPSHLFGKFLWKKKNIIAATTLSLQQSLTCLIPPFIFIPVTQSKCIHLICGAVWILNKLITFSPIIFNYICVIKFSVFSCSMSVKNYCIVCRF